jgi:hypothetical protein
MSFIDQPGQIPEPYDLQYCPEDGFKDPANPMQSKGLNAVLVFFDLKSKSRKRLFRKKIEENG